MAVTPVFSRLRQTDFKVGDWIKVVALPDEVAEWASNERVFRRNWAWVYRKCVGKRYEVLILGDDNRVYFHEDTLGSCDFAHLHLECEGELSADDYQWLKMNKNHGGYYVNLPTECVVLSPVA